MLEGEGIWLPEGGECGVLNLCKPAGMTSRQVVDRVQGVLGPLKAGHAGTLDPLATGTLLIAVGVGTRFISYLQEQGKRYRAEFLLGRESETEDIEGEVREIADARVPSREELEQASRKFLGEIQQVPPRFSAKKIKGRRAYDLARRGREFELEARPVTIERLEIVEYEYPRLVMDVACGSGTYIRSLGRDLAQEVGTSAVMSGLVRTGIGTFGIEEGVSPEDLTVSNWRAHVQPLVRCVEHLPLIPLEEEALWNLSHGRYVRREVGCEGVVAFVTLAGELCGVGRVVEGGELRPVLMVSRPLENVGRPSGESS